MPTPWLLDGGVQCQTSKTPPWSYQPNQKKPLRGWWVLIGSIRGVGGPTTASSVQTNLDYKTFPHEVPISDCVYRNSAENYKCSPNNPGKETRFSLPLLPIVVVPIQTKKGVLHLRALLDTGSTASFRTVSASSRIPSVVIESELNYMYNTGDESGAKYKIARKFESK